MIDFALSNRGDLALEKKDALSSLRIDWNIASYPAFRIDFLQSGIPLDPSPENDQLMISFHTSSQKVQDQSSAQTITEDDELRQRILILLRTEEGDLATNSAFGSRIVLEKHKGLLDKNAHGKIKAAVEKALQATVPEDDIERFSVQIIPEHLNDDSFFCQNISVKIYRGSRLFYKFSV